MTGANSGKEKPAGAWTAQETVLYMVRTRVLPSPLRSTLYLTIARPDLYYSPPQPPTPIYTRRPDLRPAARQGSPGQVLHCVPGQRDAPRSRPAADHVGCRGRRGGPTCALALAPRLQGDLRGVCARRPRFARLGRSWRSKILMRSGRRFA